MADKPEKAEKPEKVEKAEEQTAAKPAASESQEKKRRKISRMTLAEVEAQLKIVKEKMGEFQSSFARHLLARKSELSENFSKKK